MIINTARTTNKYELSNLSSCLCEVPINKKPKHNEWEKCPHCGKEITYVSRKKKRNLIWSYGTAILQQRYRNGIVERTFQCTRADTEASFHVGETGLSIRETKRILFTDEGLEEYRYEDFKLKGKCWRRQDRVNIYYGNYEKIYKRNLSALLKNTNTAYNIAVKHGYKGEPIYFMKREKANPLIEKAYKAGLYAMGTELIRSEYQYRELIDEEQTELIKALQLDKARLNRLKKMNGKSYELLWLQDEKKADTIWRDEDIKTLAEAEADGADSSILQYVSVQQAANYLRKQQAVRKRELSDIWMDWKDYINMLEKRKTDMTNGMLIRPKDLTVAHNELVLQKDMLKKGTEIEEKKKTFKKAEKLMQERLD